uniref:Cell cycle associated protein 1 n=1 Tax=Xenopus tropicalis TaxID=8364 RepID=A0A6I8RM96_XENTR
MVFSAPSVTAVYGSSRLLPARLSSALSGSFRCFGSSLSFSSFSECLQVSQNMPSATSSKAVPGSSDAAPGTCNMQSEAMKQILGIIDKKLRNLEKKKGKLDDYQDRLNKGERLNQDQMDAVTKHQEVVISMEFARELQRNFMALGQDIQKTTKKAARREQLMREEAEQKRLKTVLEFQFALDKLGDEEVRNDLKQGLNGVPVVSEEELTLLDEFYKLVDPDRDTSVRLSDQYEQASIHLWDVLDSKEKAVCGTTYKNLKDLLERILQSGYFDSAQNHQNGLCEEEEPLAAPPPAEEQAPELEPEPVEEYTEPSEVESTEFVNRQFMTEAQYSGSEKEQVDEWTVETVEVVNSLQQAATPPVPEPLALNAIAQVQPDPIVRRQRVQDLMAQMQGPYNFMQDSMLEFESQAMDPAIVSAQPMNPSQSMDLPQMLCPPVHSEPRQSQPSQVPDTTQVFNMNAPVPPVNEPETLKQNQYQASYNQTFPGQPHQVEQTELQPEQLQPVVNTYHATSDQSHQAPSGHQQPAQQNTGFPRNSQPFYNNRGMARGGQRGGYDGYRTAFPNTPNSGYPQAQFNAPRDYSNNYQRDGYQQNFKRGAGQGGPRVAPRGRGGPARPSRGMPQMSPQQVN